MQDIDLLPEKQMVGTGPMIAAFKALGVESFQAACAYVHQLPYGYNSDRDDLTILFKEGKGSCTTKHAVIATLASELGLAVVKRIGIYAMTESIVTGTQAILERYGLPYVPMVHCFLACGDLFVDLTAGNFNGKNRPIDQFLHTEEVVPNISAKEEYLRYRAALKALLETRQELAGIKISTLLRAREDGIVLLKANIGE